MPIKRDSTLTAESEGLSSKAEEGVGYAEAQEFQTQLWQLLEKQTHRYTSGESSSVPELTAHRLLSSLTYVLGIDLATLDASDARGLLEVGLEEAFKSRLASIQSQVAEFPALWEQAMLSTPLLKSRALKDTLLSLRDFSMQYEWRYFAHEIIADIDYPLSLPVSEQLMGIDYVREYLNRLIIENTFMQAFEVQKCSRLLRQFSPHYKELIINLFEPIAANALGLALVGKDIVGLNIEEEARDCIGQLVLGCPTPKLRRLLKQATTTTCNTLGLSNQRMHSYVELFALSLVPRIRHASRKTLEGIFIAY